MNAIMTYKNDIIVKYLNELLSDLRDSFNSKEMKIQNLLISLKKSLKRMVKDVLQTQQRVLKY